MSDPKPTSLFSSLSLGRAAKSPRASETLAHPLLGASTSSLNLSGDPGPSSPIAQGSSPTNHTLSSKASTSTFSRMQVESLPYKARQRTSRNLSSGSAAGIISPNITASTASIPTAPPTTSTSSTFALPPSASEGAMGGSAVAGPSSASATSRLQVQSLKASAQRLGLANGSMGMAMIDAVVDKGQVAKSSSKHGEGGDWGDIMRVLTSGKAIFFLPCTSASSLPMTPQIMREHIAFISPPIHLSPVMPSGARSSDSLSEKGREAAGETVSMVVTLSGLVGTLKGSVVTFESILEADSPVLVALRDPIQRSSVLAALRPTTLSQITTFPSITISAQPTSLAFPALGKPIGVSKDVNDKSQEASKAPVGRLGRLNPFSSLFGSSSSSTSVPPKATISEEMVSRFDLSPNAGSPNPSILSAEVNDNASILSEATLANPEGFSVQAYIIPKAIRTTEVHKGLTKSIRSHIKEELSRLPDKVIERVSKLVLASICPTSSSAQDLLKAQRSAEPDSIPTIDFGLPAQASDQLQDFMEAVYDDLVVHFRSDSSVFVAEAAKLKRKGSGGKPWGMGSEEEGTQESTEKRRREREARAEKMGAEGTERVEGLISRLLYNRLFSPLGSDDARHDEALASRIAALNMLDLSLDHLGLITRPEDEENPGALAAGLSSLVSNIGDELQNLITPSCLTPRAKAEVLIHAHKLVVDGLAELPPVQLRPEGEPYIPTPTLSQEGTLSSPPEVSQLGDPNPDLSAMPNPTTLPQSPVSPKAPSPNDEAEEKQSETSQLEEAMSDSVMTIHAPSSVPNNPVEHKASPPLQKPSKSNTSGADLILPIIIFAVVKANPPQLASQLMYLRRYRSAICLTGEASYAMVNLTAVVEFLEHVDLADLGLGGESDKVMSVADLSPIGLDYLDESNIDSQSIATASSRLRGRVFQVGELAGTAAGSANKVITGVIDSSWSAVRGLITTAASATEANGDPDTSRPSLRARQVSGFSLANVTASVASIAAAAAATTAAARSRASSRASEVPRAKQWQGNQEMVDVISRPQSIKETDKEEYPSDSDSASSDTEEIASPGPAIRNPLSDARSIRSVSSMMSKEGRKEDAGRMAERVSLSDRLANIGGFGKASGSQEVSQAPSPEKEVPVQKSTSFLASLTGSRSTSSTGLSHSRRGSLLGGAAESFGRKRADSVSPIRGSIRDDTPKPIERFMTCDVKDLNEADIGELLMAYRHLASHIGQAEGVQLKTVS